jgi:hypothetical protein
MLDQLLQPRRPVHLEVAVQEDRALGVAGHDLDLLPVTRGGEIRERRSQAAEAPADAATGAVAPRDGAARRGGWRGRSCGASGTPPGARRGWPVGRTPCSRSRSCSLAPTCSRRCAAGEGRWGCGRTGDPRPAPRSPAPRPTGAAASSTASSLPLAPGTQLPRPGNGGEGRAALRGSVSGAPADRGGWGPRA